MERGKQFLLGTKFCCRPTTTFKDLFLIKKALPKITNARLMRWALKLMAFNFDGIYVKGNSIPHVDALSRFNYSSDFLTSGVPAVPEYQSIGWLKKLSHGRKYKTQLGKTAVTRHCETNPFWQLVKLFDSRTSIQNESHSSNGGRLCSLLW